MGNWVCQAKSVQISPWPILLRICLSTGVVNFTGRFILKTGRLWDAIFSILICIIILLLWFKDLSRESLIGFHGHKLEVGLRVAMLLFILREIFFFFRFFWAFFDGAIAPTIEYGLNWPPKGIISISYYSVPLLNTIILLTRGVTVTWSHHSLIRNDFSNTRCRLGLTILLGMYFLYTQVEEYMIRTFTMADGIYGSIFFMATGFHGIHVLIGTIFLTYIIFNLINGRLNFSHHFSFEAAAWYWHFVDVVWLFLYLVVYVWFS